MVPLIWEFLPPLSLEGDFVDAQIGDIDGDGSPDLILVMNLSKFENSATPHVFVASYNWDGENLSEIPSSTLDIGKENRSLRCNNFQLLDQDADGDQEIVLSLGSPFRGFAVVNSNSGGLFLSKKVRPDQLLVGSGLLYVGVVDYDGDGYDDVIALSPDGNTIKAQPFYNIGGVFDSGPLVRKKIDGINGILTHSIKLTDWDSDGFFDILASFSSGDIIALTLTPATLVIEEVPITSGPLTQIALEDFNQDGYEDILTLSADLNSLTLISGKDGGLEGVENAMKHIPSDMQVFTMSPMTKAGLYTGGVIVSGWNGDQNATYVVNLGIKSDRLDQGYLITPEFIEKQLPALMDNIDDIEPEVPEVFVEVLPEDKKPLLPQPEEQIITDLGQSPGVYIPKTLEIDKSESTEHGDWQKLHTELSIRMKVEDKKSM